jgi:hypothetical protein
MVVWQYLSVYLPLIRMKQTSPGSIIRYGYNGEGKDHVQAIGKDIPKKVEMSLCSWHDTNTKVGQEIFNLGANQFELITACNGPFIATDGNRLTNQFTTWIRKIGKVSPNAKWITEGMYFNEDEVRLVWTGTDNIVGKDPGPDTYYEKQGHDKEYQFKCSNCGTFH